MMLRNYFAGSCAAIAATLSITAALAEDAVQAPPRKPGYWEVLMVTEAPPGMPAATVHFCIDEASDKQMMQAGASMTNQMCSKKVMTREGADYVTTSECSMGPMKSTSRSVLSGDFQAAYTVKVTGTVEGVPAMGGDGKKTGGPMKTAMTQNAKWLSDACPDGMKPGDMRMPNGMTINPTTMMNQQQEPPASGAAPPTKK